MIAELHAIGIDIEHTPNADKQFWIKTMDEVHKINEFYAKKRYDNTHRLAQLRLQMQLVNVRTRPISPSYSSMREHQAVNHHGGDHPLHCGGVVGPEIHHESQPA